MAEIDLVMLAQAVREWEEAGHGMKKAVLRAWLPILGIGEQTIYREIKKLSRKRRQPRADKGRRKKPEYEAWTREIMRLKYSRHKGVRALATADAKRLALQWGLIPAEAAIMPEGTINRIAKELEIVPRPRRENRFEGAYPNRLHQVDASGSEYFYPARLVGGEWILRLRRQQMKNKEQADRQRVWAWGLVDDYSGVRVARYVVAPGESARDGIEFLQWAWANLPEHAPFRGLPEILYLDNGALARTKAFQDFCRRLGVEIKTHEVYRPQASGKVESGWRDQWRRFEALFLRDPGWERREISLNELNQELAAFRRESNQRPHRRLPMSKEAAWLMGINQRGGVVDIAPEAWGTIFRDASRNLDAAGCFNYKSQVYQVREIHACKVYVYEGLLDGSILVEDRRTGRRYPAVPFTPRLDGEYQSAALTPLERLQQEDVNLEQEARITWQPAADGKVVHLVKRAEEKDANWELEKRTESLEELAAGVEVIQPLEEHSSFEQRAFSKSTWDQGEGKGEEAELFGTPLERYVALRIREARGERLTPAEVEFERWFEGEYKDQFDLLRGDIERRVRLAVIE